GLRPGVERGRAQVVNQADDRDWRSGSPRPADGELPADRVLPWPQLIRRRAVDHRDGRPAGAILRRKATTPADRDPESREVVRGDVGGPQYHDRRGLAGPAGPRT